MFDLEQIKGAGFDEVLRQMPAAVVIADAPSGKIVFSNKASRRWTERVLGQRVPQELGQYRDLQERSNFQMLHPDGRSYEVEEWPLTRSIKHVEEQLRESSKRIEDILESITEAFYAVDREWRFTYINERALLYMQAFKNDSDLTREELLVKDVWEVFPEAVSTAFYEFGTKLATRHAPVTWP
jgi:transcriptional regulator with PAS, ATPase and Fis domain